MRHFRKLGLHIDNDCLDTHVKNLPLIQEHGVPQKYGVVLAKTVAFKSVPSRTYMLKPEDAEKVTSLLPQSLLSIEVPEVWMLTIDPPDNGEKAMLAPHRDLVRLCGINFYFETNGERTVYYDYAKGGKLSEVESFTAMDGECYVMDVDKPHAVELSPHKTRSMLSVSFITTPYEEVVKHLEYA